MRAMYAHLRPDASSTISSPPMLIVQKYGGTSVGDVERIRNVARRVHRRPARPGHDVVVVVSAMSGETNRLLKLVDADHRAARASASRTWSSPPASRSRSAWSRWPSRTQGGKARSFLGHQVPIVTDSAFTKARIKSIDAEQHPRGAQAEAHRGGRRLPGRRRGGQHHHAGPRRLGHHRGGARRGAQGRRLRDLHRRGRRLHHRPAHLPARRASSTRISYEEMLELAVLGAKVLQIRSVEFAMKYKVPLWVKSSLHRRPGHAGRVRRTSAWKTWSSAASRYDENEAQDRRSAACPTSPGIAASIFGALDAKQHRRRHDHPERRRRTAAPTSPSPWARRTWSRPTSVVQARSAQEIRRARASRRRRASPRCRIVGVGMRNHAGVAAKMFQVLADEGINIQMISTSEIKVSCVIDDEVHGARGARAAHARSAWTRPGPRRAEAGADPLPEMPGALLAAGRDLRRGRAGAGAVRALPLGVRGGGGAGDAAASAGRRVRARAAPAGARGAAIAREGGARRRGGGSAPDGQGALAALDGGAHRGGGAGGRGGGGLRALRDAAARGRGEARAGTRADVCATTRAASTRRRGSSPRRYASRPERRRRKQSGPSPCCSRPRRTRTWRIACRRRTAKTNRVSPRASSSRAAPRRRRRSRRTSENPSALRALALSEAIGGDAGHAIEHAGQARLLSPGDPWTLYAQAVAARAAKAPDGGLDALTRLGAAHPGLLRARVDAGAMLADRGDSTAARQNPAPGGGGERAA